MMGKNIVLTFFASSIMILSMALIADAQQCQAPADCGKIQNNNLCLDYSLGTVIPATGNSGKIFYVSCSSTEMLSDGTSWFPCYDFQIKNANGRDYLCIGGVQKPEASGYSFDLYFPGGASNYAGSYSLGAAPGCGPPHLCTGVDLYLDTPVFTYSGTDTAKFTILKDVAASYAIGTDTGSGFNTNSHITLRLFRDGTEIWSEQLVPPHGSRGSTWSPPASGYEINIPPGTALGTHNWFFRADFDEAAAGSINFYVKAHKPEINLKITSDTPNYNIYERAGNPSEAVEVILTIDPEVYVSSASTTSPALTTGNLPPGSTVTITNNGRIQGKGGKGGDASKGLGQKGGDAIELTVPAKIDNANGKIYSGGGGGGAGAYTSLGSECGGSGGGGGGAGNGQRGSDNIAGPGACQSAGTQSSSDGTLDSGGVGGSAYSGIGRGGGGGPPGMPGADGKDNPGSGGAAGNAAKTNGNKLAWINEGDVKGPIEIGSGAIGQGKESWLECCGSGICSSFSGQGGKSLSTGQSVTVAGESYYCASNAAFTRDLDTLDQQNCESANFTWTGNLCCGDDENEYYNDANGIGGCWNNKAVLSGSIVAGNENIANRQGIFYGCGAIDASASNILDTHTSQPLVDNAGYCSQDTNRMIYCAANNTWQPSNGQDKSGLSFAPGTQDAFCCPQSQCWTGTSCIQSQASDSKTLPVNDFRCISGNWTEAQEKFDLQGNPGYCPSNQQCLVNVNGNFADNNDPNKNPQCISNAQYKDDNYCDNGAFTSRTKFVALQLLDIAGSGDHTLFCDTAENSLANLNYLVGQQLAENIVKKDAVNNFCVLLFDGKVVFGTSLNRPVTDIKSLQFLNAINVKNCNNAMGQQEDKYYRCASKDNEKTAFYNDVSRIMVYSNQPFSQQESMIKSVVDTIKGVFTAMISALSSKITPPDSASFVSELARFDKLYISKTGSKAVQGTVEESPEFAIKNMVIKYSNFDTDICSFISPFNDRLQAEKAGNQDDKSGIVCNKEQKTYHVLAQGSSSVFTKLNPDEIWNDLTSKLRVS